MLECALRLWCNNIGHCLQSLLHCSLSCLPAVCWKWLFARKPVTVGCSDVEGHSLAAWGTISLDLCCWNYNEQTLKQFVYHRRSGHNWVIVVKSGNSGKASLREARRNCFFPVTVFCFFFFFFVCVCVCVCVRVCVWVCVCVLSWLQFSALFFFFFKSLALKTRRETRQSFVMHWIVKGRTWK